MDLVRTRPVASFFALALALSWAVWIPGTLWLPESSVAAVMVGSFGPAVAAALLVRAQGGSLRAWVGDMARFRVGARWWLVALGLPVLVACVNAVVFTVFVGDLDFSTLPRRVGLWAANLVPVMLVGGGNEEPGWRGYALPYLQRSHDALTASLGIGVAWAVWHLPLFVLPGGYYAGKPFSLYLPMVVSLSVILTWLYNSTDGSVPVAMLFHAGVNTASALIPASLGVLNQESTRLLHMRARLVCFALIAVALTAYYGRETLAAGRKRTLEFDEADPADDRAASVGDATDA